MFFMGHGVCFRHQPIVVYALRLTVRERLTHGRLSITCHICVCVV